MSPTFEDTPLFQLLEPELLASLRPHVRRRTFKEREFLYHESQPANALWGVRSGEVRTLKATAKGRVVALESLQTHPPTLEDVFMALTGKHLRDG